MRQSMTGFAALPGSGGGADWVWEARSVNGRGLEVRLRLAEGVEALEPVIRAAVAERFRRGSIQITLKLTARATAGLGEINRAALDAALDQVATVQAGAERAGVALVPPSAAEVLALRGVVETARAAADPDGLAKAAAAGVAPLLDALAEARRGEGAVLADLLSQQLAEMARLSAAARITAEAREAAAGETLRQRVRALLAAEATVDEARLAQELAILAVKADVTEELDRLDAHTAAARALLVEAGPVGRKLEFLAQEFLREVNTLCSKSGSQALTALGLDLKAVIEQMREQVQNIE